MTVIPLGVINQVAMTGSVSTMTDVETFAACMRAEVGLRFHPDDPFEDYFDSKTGEALYMPEQACLRNELVEQAFAVCEKENVDIYETMGRVIMRWNSDGGNV